MIRWFGFLTLVIFLFNPSFAAATPIQDALKQLDNAKTWPEWVAANESLKSISATDADAARAYVADHLKDGRKRFMVFKALTRILPVATAEKEMKDALKRDPDSLFRTDCIREMGRSKNAGYKPVLIAKLHDETASGVERGAAAEALAVLGDPVGKAFALQSIKNGAPWSDFAIRTLEALKASDPISELEKHAQSSSKVEERNACRTAVLRLKLVSSDDNSRRSALQQALNSEDAPETRRYAARLLGESGTRDDAQVLARVAKDKTTPGNREALDGLLVGLQRKKWSEKEMKEWLKEK